MKIISPAVHGVLDYLVALVLIVAPFVLHLGGESPVAFWLSLAAGVGLVVYSVLTNYRNSLVKLIPFKTHLIFDFSAGAVFVAAAFLIPAHGTAFTFFLVMGVAVMAVVLLTDPVVRPAPTVMGHAAS